MKEEIGAHELWLGDCLEEMVKIPDGSIDLVLSDPPYGVTRCKWDKVIPIAPMWEQVKRVVKPSGAVVLMSRQPFTSGLILSNLENFKYCWIWEKPKATGFFDAKRRPLNNYDEVVVFSRGVATYNPQMVPAGMTYHRGFHKKKKSDCYGEERGYMQLDTGMRYPKRILRFGNSDTRSVHHPTEKPVGLMEYLVRTYTNEGERVLDFAMGSGTTGVACVNAGRVFVGIEKEEKYYGVSKLRLEEGISHAGTCCL